MLRWWIPLVVCACESTPSTTLFVATANDGDGDVSIALLTDGEHLVAYACADDVARDPYPGWFKGDVAPDGTFVLALDGFFLAGTITASGARGEIVEPDGTVVSWSGAAISHASLTGLYKDDSSGGACGASVIVIADDPTKPPIVRGAWCNVMQVTPVAPIALVNGEIAVDVAMAEAPVRMYVAPVITIPP